MVISLFLHNEDFFAPTWWGFLCSYLIRISFHLHNENFFALQVSKERAAGKWQAYIERYAWDAFDPSLVAETLFAAANIFSSLKLIYIFTVNSHLGPLQISLGRMVMDILKFVFVFLLVLFSFACGLNHLYWYYANLRQQECASNSSAESCDRKYRSFAKWVDCEQLLPENSCVGSCRALSEKVWYM